MPLNISISLTGKIQQKQNHPLPSTILNMIFGYLWQPMETPLSNLICYSCHTQSVQRCVKIVTEASLALCGQPARDGFIRSRLEARNIITAFNTKSDYRVSQ